MYAQQRTWVLSSQVCDFKSHQNRVALLRYLFYDVLTGGVAFVDARESSILLPVDISRFTEFSVWQTRAVFDIVVLVSTSRIIGSMSQARVTDFFAQRKKGIAGPVKPAKQRGSAVVGRGSTAITAAGTRSRSSKNLCSSSVHEEFVSVIDEAVGLQEEEVVKDVPPCPRTPKRSSVTEFDLGAGVFSATADHSTAKKRRQVEAVRAKANVPEKPPRRKARKKLVLPQDTPHVSSVL